MSLLVRFLFFKLGPYLKKRCFIARPDFYDYNNKVSSVELMAVCAEYLYLIRLGVEASVQSEVICLWRC